jgi:uncharacterized protein
VSEVRFRHESRGLPELDRAPLHELLGAVVRTRRPRLKELADQIDTGDEAVGEQYNHVDRINCPKCIQWPLLRMVDPQQPHIWFESCKNCYGRFYDAGEFRDFAEHTLVEFFEDLNAPARD